MNKLKLMANLPIYIDKIPIYSPQLKTIAEIGKEYHGIYLSYCTITKQQLKIQSNEVIDDYDALLYLLANEKDFLYFFTHALFYFTKLSFIPKVEKEEIVFASDDVAINKENYLKFISAVKYVNCIEVENTEELDEFDKQVLEMEKKINEAQSKTSENIELEDLISIVANMDGNNLNIINIWDLNIYQFYEQLKRGQLKEQYNLAIQQLLAGAKPEEITIESYYKNIK